MYVFDCTIRGFHPLGKPAELTAQYLILNLKSTTVSLRFQLPYSLNLYLIYVIQEEAYINNTSKEETKSEPLPLP